MNSVAQLVAQGIYFGEGPRWHEGRLWFSDFFDQAVKTLEPDGTLRTRLRIEDQPSGLGWLPDGRMLVVSMAARQVLRVDPDAVRVHADLGAIAVHRANDMVVDGKGRAWVGNFGFDLDLSIEQHGVEGMLEQHPRTGLARIDPDGSVHLGATELDFPNGMVITADGKTLIVAETLARRLSAFSIDEQGELAQRRVWAILDDCAPDGICLDSEGNIWVANALAAQCLLVAPGGAILRTINTGQPCYACMLGGEDRRTLYLLTAPGSNAARAQREPAGCLRAVRVECAGTGYP